MTITEIHMEFFAFWSISTSPSHAGASIGVGPTLLLGVEITAAFLKSHAEHAFPLLPKVKLPSQPRDVCWSRLPRQELYTSISSVTTVMMMATVCWACPPSRPLLSLFLISIILHIFQIFNIVLHSLPQLCIFQCHSHCCLSTSPLTIWLLGSGSLSILLILLPIPLTVAS